MTATTALVHELLDSTTLACNSPREWRNSHTGELLHLAIATTVTTDVTCSPCRANARQLYAEHKRSVVRAVQS